MLRAGRDKIPEKDAEKRFKLRPILNKINPDQYKKDSLYRRVKPWKHEQGAYRNKNLNIIVSDLKFKKKIT